MLAQQAKTPALVLQLTTLPNSPYSWLHEMLNKPNFQERPSWTSTEQSPTNRFHPDVILIKVLKVQLLSESQFFRYSTSLLSALARKKGSAQLPSHFQKLPAFAHSLLWTAHRNCAPNPEITLSPAGWPSRRTKDSRIPQALRDLLGPYTEELQNMSYNSSLAKLLRNSVLPRPSPNPQP